MKAPFSLAVSLAANVDPSGRCNIFVDFALLLLSFLTLLTPMLSLRQFYGFRAVNYVLDLGYFQFPRVPSVVPCPLESESKDG